MDIQNQLIEIYNIYKQVVPGFNEQPPKKLKSFSESIVYSHWKSICDLRTLKDKSENKDDINFFNSLITKHAEICISEIKI